MKKMKVFEPKNDPGLSSVKKYFSLIKEQKRCNGIPCDECPFKNKQSRKKGAINFCLVNTYLYQNKEKEILETFNFAIEYYKYFYANNIIQETFDV